MRRLFATYGIPETVVSDNGTQFVSKEFADVLPVNNVEHVQTGPKHPSRNGLAERAMHKERCKENHWFVLVYAHIQRFLLTYRITPQLTTIESPSELPFFGRRIRSR